MQQRLGLGAALLGEPGAHRPRRADVRPRPGRPGRRPGHRPRRRRPRRRGVPELAPAERGRAGLRPRRDHRPRPGRRQRRARRRPRPGRDAGPRRPGSAPSDLPAFERFGTPTLEGDLLHDPADGRRRRARPRRRPSSRWAPRSTRSARAGARSSSASSPSSPATGRRPGRPARSASDDHDRQAHDRRGRPPPRPVGPRRSSPRVAVGLTAWGVSSLVEAARDEGVGELDIKFVVSQILIFIAFMFGFVLVMTAAFFGSPAIATDLESGRRPGDARSAAAARVVPARPVARAGDRDRGLRGRVRAPRDRRRRPRLGLPPAGPDPARRCTSPARRSSCCRSPCSCRPACRRSPAARSRSSPTGSPGWPACSARSALAIGTTSLVTVSERLALPPADRRAVAGRRLRARALVRDQRGAERVPGRGSPVLRRPRHRPRRSSPGARSGSSSCCLAVMPAPPARAVAGAVARCKVLLGHGASGDAASMAPFVEGLRRRGLAADAVDLPKRKAEDAVPVWRARRARRPGHRRRRPLVRRSGREPRRRRGRRLCRARAVQLPAAIRPASRSGPRRASPTSRRSTARSCCSPARPIRSRGSSCCAPPSRSSRTRRS